MLEVDTPLLAAPAAFDPGIASIPVRLRGRTLYLQTSPESCLKRLLVAHPDCSFYQLGKAFRDDPPTARHNPEFTLLEWYRVGFDLHALMGETEALLEAVTGIVPGPRRRLAPLLEDHAGLPVFAADEATLARAAEARFGLRSAPTREEALDLFYDHALRAEAAQPGAPRAFCVWGFPPEQAALAEVAASDDGPVALRFELIVDGVELANGYQELRDADEHLRRFDAANAERRRRGLPAVAPDRGLVEAVRTGLPPCAGAALGVDRLLMTQLGVDRIDAVLPFPFPAL